MHQYTADLANRVVRDAPGVAVHLVTTSNYPADRYVPEVQVHTPLTSHNTGLTLSSLRLGRLRAVWQCIREIEPDLVHFTGPHLWNVALLHRLRQAGIPTIHTLHDLDPHKGARGGGLLHAWNGLVLRLADSILVHGRTYAQRLYRARAQVVYTPLLHLFVSHELDQTLGQQAAAVNPGEPFILFFGRLEKYKGVNDLLTAYAQLRGVFTANGQPEAVIPRLVLAGPGRLHDLWVGSLPPGVEVRNRLVGDAEAVDLFRRCSLVALPYVDGTQSALIPAAYYFGKPVVVTRVGALAEYVEEARTGLVVEPGHPASLTRALYAALSDPDRLAQMGLAGRAWYEQQREQETRQLWQLYRWSSADRQRSAARGEWQIARGK